MQSVINLGTDANIKYNPRMINNFRLTIFQKAQIMLSFIGLIFIILIFLHLIFHSERLSTFTIISHRGVAGLAPENTLAGIAKAVELKVDVIEVDLQRTTDEILVLLHDKSVVRTTNGVGDIKDLRWDAVKKLDAGSYFSNAFKGEEIPTIQNALELIRNTTTTLAIELKEPNLYPNIESQLINTLRGANAIKNVIVVSFDEKSLYRVKSYETNLPIGILWFLPWAPKIEPDLKVKTVSVFWGSCLINPHLIYSLHRQGYQVWVWTVNNTFLMRLLIAVGVDGITTDRPDILAGLLQKNH